MTPETQQRLEEIRRETKAYNSLSDWELQNIKIATLQDELASAKAENDAKFRQIVTLKNNLNRVQEEISRLKQRPMPRGEDIAQAISEAQKEYYDGFLKYKRGVLPK